MSQSLEYENTFFFLFRRMNQPTFLSFSFCHVLQLLNYLGSPPGDLLQYVRDLLYQQVQTARNTLDAVSWVLKREEGSLHLSTTVY